MPCPLVLLSVATVAAAPSCARAEPLRQIEPRPAAPIIALAAARNPPMLNLAVRKARQLPPEAVEVPVKEEWTNDEGFRMAGARVAFKRRF